MSEKDIVLEGYKIGDTVFVISGDCIFDEMTGEIVDIYEEFHDNYEDFEAFLCHMVKFESGEIVGFPGAELVKV